MIVRLKVEGLKAIIDKCNEFQFYDSPIKSDDVLIKNIRREIFQFYDSPIKRQGSKEKT